MKMNSTEWETEEDIFAQQCGAGIPSGEFSAIIENLRLHFVSLLLRA